MRAATCRIVLCAMAMLAAAPSLHAQPCAGFNDVDVANPFCANVQWLKNRGVTIGCTSPTLYCPGELVSRESMAIFLQRLGNALTPTVISGYNSGSALDIDTLPVICPSGVYTPAYARTAHGTGMVLAWTAPALSMDVSMTLVRRLGAAAAWTPIAGVPAQWSVVGNAMYKAGMLVIPPQSLEAGVTYEWGLQIGRIAGSSSTGDIAGWNCQILVEVENRITSAPPYDEDEDALEADDAE